MNEKQIELVFEAIRLIRRRSVDPRRTVEQKMSYTSAYDMLMYALNEGEECLAQFDDVQLDCQDCRRYWSDDASDIQLCNACCKEEFFL